MSALDQIRKAEGYLIESEKDCYSVYMVTSKNESGEWEGSFHFYKTPERFTDSDSRICFISEKRLPSVYCGSVRLCDNDFPVSYPLKTSTRTLYEGGKLTPPDVVQKKIVRKVTKAQSYKKKPIKERSIAVLQVVPITVDNFFLASYGVFKELKSIPSGFTKFFSSRGSAYYTNADKTELIRQSDHWGYAIRFCEWHLEGYEKDTSWNWQKKHGIGHKIGLINFSELLPNRKHKPNQIHLTVSSPF